MLGFTLFNPTYIYNYTQECVSCQVFLKKILNLFMGGVFHVEVLAVSHILTFNTNYYKIVTKKVNNFFRLLGILPEFLYFVKYFFSKTRVLAFLAVETL